MSKRIEALKTARECGEVSRRSDERKAQFFDCDIADVSDVFENRCENVQALCEAAGVTEQEVSDAYADGQAQKAVR